MTSGEVLYSEKQRFRQWWLWLTVLIPSIIVEIVFIWALYQQILLNSKFGDNPTSNLVLIVLAIVFGVGFGIGLPILLYICGLDTKITKHGIYIKFLPFHRKWIIFEYGNIATAEPLTYSPLKDYGGWGIRYSRKGKAYNVSGNKGVFLTLKDKRNILVGPNDHKVLCSLINKHIPRGC